MKELYKMWEKEALFSVHSWLTYGTNHLKVSKSYRLHGVFSGYHPSKRTVFINVPYNVMHGTIENMAEFN